MKIRELLMKAVQVLASREICYHGTSSVFLRQILKQGLIPNPNKKVYDDPEDRYVAIPIQTFEGGIYLTTNFMTAYAGAGQSSRKFGGNRLIVICDVERKTMEPDEDDITLSLYRSFGESTEWTSGYSNFNIAQVSYTWTEFLKNEKIIEEYKHKFLIGLQKRLKIPQQQLGTIKQITDDLWVLLLKRVVAQGYQDTTNFQYYILGQMNVPREQELETLEFIEQSKPKSKFLKETKNKIIEFMHKIKYFAYDSGDRFADSFRLTEPLKFSGSNKIIAICEIEEDATAESRLKTVYGKIPESFIKDFIQFIGPISKTNNP